MSKPVGQQTKEDILKELHDENGSKSESDDEDLDLDIQAAAANKETADPLSQEK